MSEEQEDINKDKEILRIFLSENTILIADPTRISAERLSEILVDIGANKKNIYLCENFKNAVEILDKFGPNMIISEYNLGDGSAFELFEKYRKIRDDVKKCLLVLVTSNTSQAHVARAAEEEIDTFIIKPYKTEFIKAMLVEGTKNKLNPSEYIKFIQRAEELIDEKKLKDAKDILLQAKKLVDEPTLAHYYLGQVERMEDALKRAKINYKAGLSYNDIHFKCLIALYEVLKAEGHIETAYEVIKKLVKYFPANPERLNQVIRMAISTKNYRDIEGFYKVFMDLEIENDDLKRYISAALVTLGKFYLSKSKEDKAFEVYKRAANICQGRSIVLRNIIESLVDNNHFEMSNDFISEFLEKDFDSEDYKISLFLVNAFKEADLDKVIERGKEMIEKEMIVNKTVFKILHHLLRKVGRDDEAKEIFSKKEQIYKNL